MTAISRRWVPAGVRRLLWLAVLLSWMGAWARAGAAEEGGWVDTHAHLIYMAGRGPASRPEAAEYRRAGVQLIAEMDRSGVAKAILLSPPGMHRARREGLFVDMVREAVQAYPGRLYFLGGGDTLNPMIQGCAAEKVTPEVRAEFEREAEALVRKGARGFGEMAALHLSMHEGHPFEEVAPDHPLFLLLADIAARHGLPIDLHMDAVPGDMAFPAPMKRLRELNPAQLKGNLQAFGRLLAHNRGAPLVWQHAGSDPLAGMTVARLREFLQAHTNLYIGLRMPFERPLERPPMPNSPVDSSGTIKPEWLALFSDFPDRFMVGTDIFVQQAETSEAGRSPPKPQPYAVFSLIRKLPSGLRARIGCENAIRLYGLK